MELSQGVKVVKGLPGKWEKCSRTVSLQQDSYPRALACWKDLIAVGFDRTMNTTPSKIITLDATTGACLSILSLDNGWVTSLTFSPDGTSLVSGGGDGDVKLWDMQTGGIVKTFHGHTTTVVSVSVSLDCTRIASGSWDETISLWDMQTGECCYIIDEHKDLVYSVSFSPTNSQLLISASRDNTVRWWDTNGCQIGPTYEGHHAAFSSDGAYFVSCEESTAVVRTSKSGAVIAVLQVPSDRFECCNFSLDGKFVAGAAGNTIYIWDITGSGPCLVETLTGHRDSIISLVFSPSLTSLSKDGSIKFWQSSASFMNSAVAVSGPTPLALASIRAVTLQTDDGIAISHDSAGVVRSWDILTGLCKATFQGPVVNSTPADMQGDMRLIDDGLIIIWYRDKYMHIWNIKKGASPSQVIDVPWKSYVTSPVMSRDGSKVFLLVDKTIQAWSVWTGKVVGGVKLEGKAKLGRGFSAHLTVHDSRVWVDLKDSQTQGWDFGTSGSAPIPLSNVAPGGPDLVLRTKWGKANRYRVEDKVTGDEVFQLSGRYAHPTNVQCDGRYLVAGYGSGEVLILDLLHMLPQQKYVEYCPSYSRGAMRCD